MSDGSSPGGGKSPLAGGAPLALLIMAGTIIGGLFGQPSIGLLCGLVLGIIVAVVIWLNGRR